MIKFTLGKGKKVKNSKFGMTDVHSHSCQTTSVHELISGKKGQV